MSIPRPYLGQFVRMPRELQMVMRVQRQTGANLNSAGALALIAAGCAGFAFFKQTDAFDTYATAAITAGIVLAAVGGVLSLLKQEIGAPLAAGGITPFIGLATTYAGAWFSSHSALDSTEAKLFVAAGVLGIAVVVLAVIGLAGDGNAAMGAVIALMALVFPVCIAAIVHLDDLRVSATISAVVGQGLVAIVIAVGGLRGRLGGIVSVVGAGLLLPGWIDIVKNNSDRKAASLAALLAAGVIIVLGVVLVLLSIRGFARIADPTLVTAEPVDVVTTGAAAVTAPVVMPVYAPPPAVAQPNVGPVVRPVGPPATPVPQPTNGQWATDPYGRYQVRYWNGKRWTDHVASNGITGLDPIETE